MRWKQVAPGRWRSTDNKRQKLELLLVAGEAWIFRWQGGIPFEVDLGDSDGLEPFEALVTDTVLARWRLQNREPVTPEELAAISGVDAAEIRGLLRADVLHAAGEAGSLTITAGEARAWLSTRGFEL